MGKSEAASSGGQVWNASGYARNARFVADLGEPLLALLAPRAGERILDLGCGDGALTAKIAAAGAIVVGVDSSADQVNAARARGLDARIADGEALDFSAEFDGVFSNAALHWMRRPDKAIDGAWRALKQGGRFVGEMGGAGNVDTIVAALIAAFDRRGRDGRAVVPWYFPSPAEYRAKLERRGFALRSIELIPRPTELPTGIEGWLETFAGAFLARLDPAERPGFIAEVAAALRPVLADSTGKWIADYVRLRFVAEKPHG